MPLGVCLHLSMKMALVKDTSNFHLLNPKVLHLMGHINFIWRSWSHSVWLPELHSFYYSSYPMAIFFALSSATSSSSPKPLNDGETQTQSFVLFSSLFSPHSLKDFIQPQALYIICAVVSLCSLNPRSFLHPPLPQETGWCRHFPGPLADWLLTLAGRRWSFPWFYSSWGFRHTIPSLFFHQIWT